MPEKDTNCNEVRSVIYHTHGVIDLYRVPNEKVAPPRLFKQKIAYSRDHGSPTGRGYVQGIPFFNRNKIAFQIQCKIRCCLITNKTFTDSDTTTVLTPRVPICISLNHTVLNSNLYFFYCHTVFFDNATFSYTNKCTFF
jgi:hypothetical protein